MLTCGGRGRRGAARSPLLLGCARLSLCLLLLCSGLGLSLLLGRARLSLCLLLLRSGLGLGLLLLRSGLGLGLLLRALGVFPAAARILGPITAGVLLVHRVAVAGVNVAGSALGGSSLTLLRLPGRGAGATGGCHRPGAAVLPRDIATGGALPRGRIVSRRPAG